MKDDKSKSEVNIIFAIALRSQGSTDNWKNVTENFNNTLKSIFNLNYSRHRLIIASTPEKH